MRTSLLLGFALCWLVTSLGSASEWTRFRGPAGSGIAKDSLPSQLDPEANLKWKTACEQGASSPVIFGGRVFLSGHQKDERVVECFDVASGNLLWRKTTMKVRQEVATPPGGAASSTPVVDAAGVYVLFPDAGLVSYSHDGEERWHVQLAPFQSFHGVASSLILAENRLVLVVDQLQGSFISAFDTATGAEFWKADRQNGPIGGYSTPATRVNGRGALELVASGPLEIVGYDAATGKRNWTASGLSSAPISVPIVVENRVFVCEPSFAQNPFPIDTMLRHDANKDGELSFEELKSDVRLSRIAKLVDTSFGNSDGKINAAEMDKAFESFVSGGGLAAIELDESGPETKATVKWNYRKSVPQIPSMLAYDGVLFMIQDGGILTSLNAATGEVLKRARVGSGAKYYASPIAAEGRILLLDTEGKAAVVSAEAEWQTHRTTDLKDRCFATPALAAGKVFVRGAGHLYCFGDNS